MLRLPFLGDVEARVIAPTLDGYRIGLSPDAEQRDVMIAKLHTQHATPGTDKGDVGLMIRELARALTR
jgi:cellulose synthase (UDP-forming)